MDCLIKEPFCRTEQIFTQRKTTGLITDALGPFADEPLLHVVDKTLFYTCDLYTTFNEPDLNEFYNSEFPTDTPSIDKCPSKCASEVSMAQLSSKMSLALSQSRSRNLTNLLKKSFSTSNLSQLSKMSQNIKIDACSPKPKCIKDVNPYQECGDVKSHQWVKTKSTTNGIKCYEIWSDDMCQKCPSMVFILSPSGDAISFESVPDN